MKLLKTKSPYLTKQQWKKVFTAMTVMTLILYAVACIFSLCGSKYFILDYQNAQMDKIESWFRSHSIYGLINMLFNAIEFTVIISFILKKFPNPLYVLVFYGIEVGLAFIHMPDIVYTLYPFIFYILVPIIDQLVNEKHVNKKLYGKQMLRMLITIPVTMILQFAIYIIKSGNVRFTYLQMNLSATFIYAIEYEIALSVILYTVLLYLNREKGDSKLWTTDTAHGGSSQTSTMQSQKSLLMKKLTKTQKNKLRWLYAKVYLIQITGFLLLMVLPFLTGKVFEFLVMYTSFAVVRYLLGFKYSLHFKKESICITVGVIVFGILALAVPFFTVLVIIAVAFGTTLAILLHLSYKYKSMWLFSQAAKPDKFAVLYVFFEGDLTETHVKRICRYKGLEEKQVLLIWHYVKGDKISYLAYKFNYSQRMIIYKLDEAIEKLTE